MQSLKSIAAALALCLALAATAQAAEPQAGKSRNSYTVGPEDVLDVSVWKDEALSKEVVVRPDGKISFPLIGDVQAQGRTVDQIRQEIQTRIEEFVPGAPVSVMALQIRSPKIYIVGKVMRPGMYVMFERMSVMQALALAGGFTPFSATADILVLRDEGGKQVTINVDYDDLAKGKRLDQNILLNTGDTIVVP